MLVRFLLALLPLLLIAADRPAAGAEAVLMPQLELDRKSLRTG